MWWLGKEPKEALTTRLGGISHLETARRLQEGSMRLHTLPSLNVDLDPGGYLEDLGAILEVLVPMVITI